MFFLKTNSQKCDRMRGEMQEMKETLKEQTRDITLKVLAILGLVAVTYPFLIALFLWVVVR